MRALTLRRVWILFIVGFGLGWDSARADRSLTTWRGDAGRALIVRASPEGELSIAFPTLDQDRWGGSVTEGSSRPLVSPGERWLAFVREGNLFLLDAGTGQSRQMTTVARPGTEQLSPVLVNLVGWSPDGRRLLYHVGHGLLHGYEHARRGPSDMPYGFYVMDPENGSTQPLSLPEGAHGRWWVYGWAGNDTILFVDPYEASGVLVRLVSIHPPHPVRTLTSTAELGQIAFHPSGKKVLGVDTRAGRSQVVELDLEWGKVEIRSPEGDFTEYQWPKYSPEGKRVSYQHFRTLNSGRTLAELVVDGQVRFRTAELISYAWKDESSAIVQVFSDRLEFAVLDVDSGAICSRLAP